MQEEYEFLSVENDDISQRQYLQELVENDAITHNEELYLQGYNTE